MVVIELTGRAESSWKKGIGLIADTYSKCKNHPEMGIHINNLSSILQNLDSALSRYSEGDKGIAKDVSYWLIATAKEKVNFRFQCMKYDIPLGGN